MANGNNGSITFQKVPRETIHSLRFYDVYLGVHVFENKLGTVVRRGGAWRIIGDLESEYGPAVYMTRLAAAKELVRRKSINVE